MEQHMFLDKAIFFPEYGILAIGDLHVGYEHALQKSGVLVPERQVEDIIKNLEEIILKLKEKKLALKKIIFLGDIKHYFNYEWKEKFNFNKILDFLKKYVKDSDIILIKGNHDKFDFAGKKMKNYYFNKGVMFFHGHMDFPQIFEDKAKTWVFGHLHPSVILSDKVNVKREKYKCFLIGNYKGKDVFILPSFFGMVEGTALNDKNYERDENFSVIPAREIQKFKVQVIGDDGKIFNFGKVGNVR